MYKFKLIEHFPYPLDVTFEATSKDFDPLQKYVPNVTKIKTKKQEMLEDGREFFLLRFHGDGAIPAIARPVIKPKMLRWHEEMICDHEKKIIEWKVITDYFTEYVHSSGFTYYYEEEKGTKVVIDGTFDITLKRLPGLPDRLVQKAVKIVVPFIGKLAEPNMKDFYKAVKKRMNDEYGDKRIR